MPSIASAPAADLGTDSPFFRRKQSPACIRSASRILSKIRANLYRWEERAQPRSKRPRRAPAKTWAPALVEAVVGMPLPNSIDTLNGNSAISTRAREAGGPPVGKHRAVRLPKGAHPKVLNDRKGLAMPTLPVFGASVAWSFGGPQGRHWPS